MTDEPAQETSAPSIVFVMPSLRADDDVPTVDTSLTVGQPTKSDETIAMVAAAAVDAPAEPVQVAAPEPVQEPEPEPVQEPVAEVPAATPFAPPTPDTRAEYMYSLVEIERQRILDATESMSGKVRRHLNREK